MTSSSIKSTVERQFSQVADNYRTSTVHAMGEDLAQMVADKLAANLDRYLSRIPLNRIAEPEDVANAVVFLASGASGYMTGATLDLTGGLLMR